MERGLFRLVTLRTGARAVQHLEHGEVMHPSVGPWAEAQRLYVEGTRLRERLATDTPGPCVVWDVGLGAGTNAAAVLDCAARLTTKERRPLVLCSFERDLDALWLALGDAEGFPYLQPWAGAVQALVERGHHEAEGLSWRLWRGGFEDALAGGLGAPPPPAELVLYDPFSPKANPALWTRQVLSRVREVCAPGPEDESLLVTYSASTRTRVSLLLAGWYVGTGPSTGNKGETTAAATKQALLAEPLGARWLERWERSSARAPHGEELTPELETRLRTHLQFA